MSKGIELTPSQIKAYENGATMFLFPISKNILFNGVADWCNKHKVSPFDSFWYNEAIKSFSPIQKGDKDIFVQEEFRNNSLSVEYKDGTEKYFYKKNKLSTSFFSPSSQMTKKQSRYSFSECIDVKVIRIQDINGNANIYNKLGIKWSTPKSYEGRCINMETALEDFYNIQLKERGINRIYKDKDYIILAEFKY